MSNFKPLALATALFFSGLACEPAANSNATNTNAGNRAAVNSNVARTAPAAASKDALFALEKQAWEGWKNRDAKSFEAVMSDKYVGFASTGRIGKAESVKSLSDQKCEIKSYSFSDEQMTPVGPDVALLTFKALQDGVCDGKTIPPTGKRFALGMVTIGHWNANGQMDHEWLFWDGGDFMKQLGLAK